MKNIKTLNRIAASLKPILCTLCVTALSLGAVSTVSDYWWWIRR
jgi:hypothetical protein